VHLRPPHEPYNPPPEHDLFGDPSYEGPANGELEYILAVGTGKLAWSPADRDQLMALYDGNLHMGDAWTRRIVEAWREQRPGRETVTIVLSDHGEAFGEHGHFSHNSTLYDEMIHVPLIIHPRHRAESLGDPGDLRSLADVTPMVLRLVGAAVPAEVSWPEHFVQVRRGRAGARPSIVQRIAGGEWVGLRTPEFLALYRDSRHQELYDTQADPGQTHDLRLEEGGAYAAPVGTILRLLDHKAEFGLEADSGEFDPAAEQRLKALGY
jgi:arylsulfatase A-like enzyme